MRLILLFVLVLPVFAEKVRILRDEFGVPHIFASTAEGAAFASGYAQAEDRLEEMMRNYRKAEGTLSEVDGPGAFWNDYRQRLWGHRRIAEQRYGELPAHIRRLAEAFQRGVARFMSEHPAQAPAWAPKLAPWQVVALGRYIIWGWPEGEIGGKLVAAGIPIQPLPYRGSNQMLLAPSRTAMRAPIAVIDPHLSWYGEFRFYEMRVYAGKLAYSGAAILGVPFPSLGHSRYTSIAMTTGGPDTSDIYEEEVAGGKYRFRDEWRPLETRKEVIRVKTPAGMKEQEVAIESTHHGPIVARKGGKAYSAAIPYAGEFRLMESMWNIAMARNLAEVKQALAMRQFMAQNIMVGTVDGDIYYVRNGRVPVRPKGCDSSRPMPGATGACEWQGIHPFEDLVQIANPPQGYMQNCNVSPFAMMKDSPLVPEKWAERPYLYNAGRVTAHQRAAMMLELLDAARDVTGEQAIEIAFSPQVYKAETWQAAIRQAAPGDVFAALLAGWNRRSDADSRAALGFYLFKTALGQAGRAIEPTAVTPEQIRDALRKAQERLNGEFGPQAVFGTLFRVGRQGTGRTWPVGGGSLTEAGMATPRAIGFSRVGREMVGRSGQTSTQIVILTRPPSSYMVIPLGESDHPDSPHYDDQAAKLFSKSRAKSTYFLNRRELEKHVTSRRELTF
ncbi:MAG: penicillin acylase family protein [Bryobacteraceae bacterium]